MAAGGSDGGVKRKRRKGKAGRPPASSSSSVNSKPSLPAPHLVTPGTSAPTDEEAPLVLTGDKRRGLYECDYCRADISQVPRIRCAVCPDFDLCLDCFATTDHAAASNFRAAATAAAVALSEELSIDEGKAALSKKKSGGGRDGGSGTASPVPGLSAAAANHDHSHGYRVADSTRFPMFPATRSVVPVIPAPAADGAALTNEDKTKTGSNEEEEAEPKKGRLVEIKGGVEKTDKEGPDNTDDWQGDNRKDDGGGKEYNSKQESPEEEKGGSSEAKGIDGEDGNKSKDRDAAAKGSGEVQDTGAYNSHRPGEETAGATGPVIESWTLQSDDPKAIWTAEEDLRLLDAVSTLGLGNWADISEAVSSGGGGGPGAANKSARRCMERFCDDFLGRYGHILPEFTLVECEESDEEGGGDGADEGANGNDTAAAAAAGATAAADPEAATGASRKRKRSQRTLLKSLSSGKLSVASSSKSASNSCTRIMKKMRVGKTSSLPGYDAVWPDPYIPPLPGVKLGDEVNRDFAYKAEQTFVKAVAGTATRDEADRLRAEWVEKRLNQHRGPKVLPPALEDIRTMPGAELAGFMPRRGDFDMEWDNEAESILADMEFSPNDHPQDRALKLQVIEIYNTKLDERERRKKFLVERGLLDYRKNQLEDQSLPHDERDLVSRMRLFARFHSPQEHDECVEDLLKAKRLRKEIAKLQMYRRMGITSLAEAERYELDKSRRGHHKIAVIQKEMEEAKAAKAAGVTVLEDGAKGGSGATAGAGSSANLWKQYKGSDRKSRRSLNRSGSSGLDHEESNRQSVTGDTKKGRDDAVEGAKNDNGGPTSSTARVPANKSGQGGFDIMKSPGYDFLSAKEIKLCKKLRLLPAQYLDVKKALIKESLTQGLLDKDGSVNACRSIVKIDIEKRDQVIDFIVQAGWISARPRSAALGNGGANAPSTGTVSASLTSR